MPTLRICSPERPWPPGLSGRWDSKEQEEPEEGSANRPPAPNLPGKLVRREGPGPGPRREEGRPQLHPAPLAFFPALLRLLLLFLLYESGISQGFGAATRGPGVRSCSSRRRRRCHRVRSPSAGAATAAGTRVPGAHGPWRGRPRAQTVAGAATAAAAAAAAPPRRALRPPAPWRAGGSPAGRRQPGSAAGVAAAARARWPLARLGEAAAGGSRRSKACSANTPTSSRAGRTGKVPAARATARPSLRAAQCVCECVRARSYHGPAGCCHRRALFLRSCSSPGGVLGMGSAMTPPQGCTAVAEREARALVFFGTGTCRDWSRRSSALVPGPAC